MFTSSVSFSIDMHYCLDELKSISFFGKAKSCHEKAAITPKNKGCKHHQKKKVTTKACAAHQQKSQTSKPCAMDEKNCCENKTLHFQADFDEQVQPLSFINTELQQFVAAFVTTFVVNDCSIESETTSFIDYQSPLIARDIHVLIESFLL